MKLLLNALLDCFLSVSGRQGIRCIAAFALARGTYAPRRILIRTAILINGNEIEMNPDKNYDAIMIVSFGGPEGPDDVMPFLENVLRGKNVPRERMLEVSEHYKHFGGISPINEQNRQLVAALETELTDHDINIPVYWGNRNWDPLLPDALQKMKDDGIENALAFFTSIYSCYSGCRQYRENIAEAQAHVGEGAPDISKLRMAFNHPLYIEASVARVKHALDQIPTQRQSKARFVFTAHSIPMSMATGSDYAKQLTETCRLIMEALGDYNWDLVYQSRSGSPHHPWLEPDVCDHIQTLKTESDATDLVLFPVGFISDHMEVLFDLDTEAKEICDTLGINMVRAKSVGIHPAFVSMIRELILERTSGAEKRATGTLPANWDVCPPDCCSYDPTKRPPQTRITA
jgi:ferrochelatase